MTDAQDEDNPWSVYTQNVRKLHERTQEDAPQPKKKEPQSSLPQPNDWMSAPAPQEEPIKAEPPLSPPRPQAAPLALDPRVERNMSLGDVVIEARLDLHGRTEQDAYEAFVSFVETQHKKARRMLLVITGKGPDGTSVLRANLPRWCTASPLLSFVLAVRTAAPHHGGDGAYYVLLRKKGV